MSPSSRAVFLSYASQDADAARRVGDALRAGGVEVWFDQSELRGGDVWDQKIRQQIRQCALIIPMISANTQSRLEGYFRREWRMAVDRTQDMADGIPFLVPVVIDDTAEREAHVPEAFRSVQWTRLPAGETPAHFVQRIAALLEPRAPAPFALPVDTHRARSPRARWWRLCMSAAALIAAAFLAVHIFSPPDPAGDADPATPAPPIQPPKDSPAGKTSVMLPLPGPGEPHDA